MAKKAKKKQVKLVSEEKTGFFYVTTNTSENKLRIKKYDKKIRKHCWFKQEKID